MAKDEDDVVDVEGSNEELEEEVEEGDDVGIFDEDLEGDDDEDSDDEDVVFLDEMLEDNVDEGFLIGDNILSVGNVEQGWSRADLEEALRQERILRDWQDSEDFVGSDFYDEAGRGRDFYESKKREDDFYKSSSKDFYRGSQGSENYETGNLYSGKKGSVEYDSGARNLQSYDEFASGRKGEPSVLESMGFGSGKKDKRRDFREYETRR